MFSYNLFDDFQMLGGRDWFVIGPWSDPEAMKPVGPNSIWLFTYQLQAVFTDTFDPTYTIRANIVQRSAS